MAALDPSEPAQVEETANGTTRPRATLKILRQQIEEDDEENEEYMRALLAESDDEESESEEEANGGPSDPAKSKKARKAAALKELMESIGADSDEDMEEAGAKVVKKGKAKVTEEDSEEDSDDDSEGSEDVEIEEFVLCTLDPEKVRFCQHSLTKKTTTN